ncbi:MAG: hypothetical protein HY067_19930 [Betaproteobacteria bacterium]|nr:hypothetical protein [Betaproteobacteria bacterium]
MNSGFRQLSVALGRVLIGAMLFAQLVNAGQACIMPPLSPVMAFANADHHSHCAKRVNPNSCLQQSTATDQSFSQAELPVSGMPDVVVLTLPRELVATTSYIVATAVPHRSTDPPLSIRYCSFQL